MGTLRGRLIARPTSNPDLVMIFGYVKASNLNLKEKSFDSMLIVDNGQIVIEEICMQTWNEGPEDILSELPSLSQVKEYNEYKRNQNG